MNTEVMKEYTVKEQMERAVKALEVFNVKHELKSGMFVQWKPGMKNRLGCPEYGEPALVVAVHAEPLYDRNQSAGTRYFNEPLDLVLAEIDENDGDLKLFHFDSRRFEPYKG